MLPVWITLVFANNTIQFKFIFWSIFRTETKIKLELFDLTKKFVYDVGNQKTKRKFEEFKHFTTLFNWTIELNEHVKTVKHIIVTRREFTFPCRHFYRRAERKRNSRNQEEEFQDQHRYFDSFIVSFDIIELLYQYIHIVNLIQITYCNEHFVPQINRHQQLS